MCVTVNVCFCVCVHIQLLTIFVSGKLSQYQQFYKNNTDFVQSLGKARQLWLPSFAFTWRQLWLLHLLSCEGNSDCFICFHVKTTLTVSFAFMWRQLWLLHLLSCEDNSASFAFMWRQLWLFHLLSCEDNSDCFICFHVKTTLTAFICFHVRTTLPTFAFTCSQGEMLGKLLQDGFFKGPPGRREALIPICDVFS